MKNSYLVACAFIVSCSCHVVAGPLVPKWISGDTLAREKPAPMLDRTFKLDALPKCAVFEIAVAGWCEVQVNGTKAGENVLSPVTCQPDRRLSRIRLDVTKLLRKGENRIGVLLGNGWFNTFTLCSWYFADGVWLAAPQIRGSLVCDGRTVLVTDGQWRAYDSPIVFTALRNGEWYDARREGKRLNERAAKVEKYAPAGRESPEIALPCREFDTFTPVKVVRAPDGADIYDFGANISGWCEIDMKGAAGAKLTFDYDESLTPSNTLLGHVVKHVERYNDPCPAQHDEYTLAGRPDGETWHPRFTYHGFRYVKVTKTGEATVTAIRARFVHTAFDRAGTIETSVKSFTALQAATERSYLSNFVGIPTDCPHREKNGWTGDAQLAMETGLWNFDGKNSYEHFLQMLLDAQRANGAVPCIVPCSQKFGYAWGSGPAWDAILFEIPWQLYRFYGDDRPARAAWAGMKAYLDFIETQADADGLFAYGLGDWCAPDRKRIAELRLTDSAYVYCFNRRAAFWADRFGESAYAAARNRRAEEIKAAFNAAFYKGNGIYAKGEWTELAAPLFFKGLCKDGEEKAVAARLVDAVRAKNHKADFGILGAKWVPRVLADYGYFEDAWQLFTQPEQPGWMHWLTFGDGTLREKWDDTASHNHIMFGDLSAWAYEYVAGIVPLGPGFSKIAIRPHFPKGVKSFSATHKTPYGEIRVSWKRYGDQPVVECSVPDGIEVVGPRPLPALNDYMLDGLAAPVHYFAAQPLSAGDPCEVAFVVVHGWGDNPKTPTSEALPFREAARAMLGPEAVQPFVVTASFPRRKLMKHFGLAEDGRAIWNDSWDVPLTERGKPDDDWRGGGDANGTTLSSFDVIDRIFDELSDTNRFPRLRRVVLAGFSAGGQFVGRYAAVGKGKMREGVALEYMALAPSTELRLDDDIVWHYGLKDRPRYSRNLTREQIYANLSSRRVWRACGVNDIKGRPYTALDSCPEALRQGVNRFVRFRNFEEYLKGFPEWKRMVSFYAIPEIGHECLRAYVDPKFVRFVLGECGANGGK